MCKKWYLCVDDSISLFSRFYIVVEIVQTLILDTEPDEHVKRAMDKINGG